MEKILMVWDLEINAVQLLASILMVVCCTWMVCADHYSGKRHIWAGRAFLLSVAFWAGVNFWT